MPASKTSTMSPPRTAAAAARPFLCSADHGEQLHPVGRVQVRAEGAGGQVEHGPHARVVLVQDIEQFLAVALPPAARVAADQRAGQPGGQRGPHQMPNAVAVRRRPTRTICCIVGQLLGQHLLPGRGDLIRAAALLGGQRPHPAAALQPRQRAVQGAGLHPARR